MEEDIKDLIGDVHLFNEIAGNYNNVDKDSLFGQSKLIVEEAKELYDAINLAEGDAQILKETCDLLVVAFGMVGKLQHLGYDVSFAWQVVNANNLTKFPDSEEEVMESISDYKKQGVYITPEYNNQYECYVLKDENGKVRKKSSYKKCSVEAFTPKG